MGGVALLLEEAFREDLGFMRLWSRIPILRELSAQLWAASFAPPGGDALLGFVWEENHRIIGNVTLTLDDARKRQWLISNVAVYPEFRRRGIARELMHMATDEAIRRRGVWLTLNVRPFNTGAIRLYEQLGFDTVDTEMGYSRAGVAGARRAPLSMRPLKSEEFPAALDLARAGMSDRYKLFRPLRDSSLPLNPEDRVAEQIGGLFTGQVSERWGYDDPSGLAATLSVRGKRIGSPHSFEIRVRPDVRGSLESGLVAFALERLARFRGHSVRTKLLTSHTQLVEALTEEGFAPATGLVLMAKPLTGLPAPQ